MPPQTPAARTAYGGSVSAPTLHQTGRGCQPARGQGISQGRGRGEGEAGGGGGGAGSREDVTKAGPNALSPGWCSCNAPRAPAPEEAAQVADGGVEVGRGGVCLAVFQDGGAMARQPVALKEHHHILRGARQQGCATGSSTRLQPGRKLLPHCCSRSSCAGVGQRGRCCRLAGQAAAVFSCHGCSGYHRLYCTVLCYTCLYSEKETQGPARLRPGKKGGREGRSRC